MTERAFRTLGVLSVVLAGAGGLAMALSWHQAPPRLHVSLVLLGLAAVLVENAAVVSSGRFSASLLWPLSLATAILLGPTSAGLIMLLGSVSIDDLRRRVGLQVVAFNTGQMLLTVLVSGWLYLAVGGRTLLLPNGAFRGFYEAEFPGMLVPLLVLGVSAAGINNILVGLGFKVKYGGTIGSLWARHLRWHFFTQLSFIAVAVSVAQVMSFQVAGLVLFIFPLLVSRQVYQNYLALRQSYVDTVRSLVAALEAKDRYTAGHSERVAQYSVAIAEAMGLPDETVERIDLAAQLHDLGKVSISGEVLSKPGRLTSEEFEAIRAHPEVGADLLVHVPGLTHIVPIVRHHHERYDGGGYCAGLAGDEIPLEARIMAVADAFDAMTSSRAYRAPMALEAAVTEVRECAGSQFDPDVVEHMLRSSIVDGEVGTE